jgi:hypothetical protein
MSMAEGNKTPDEIRAEIERTRGNLGYDVDALADKVNPSSIAHRQTEKVKSRFNGFKESVMGSVNDVRGSDAADALKDAPHRAAEAAKGNGLAVGLVAFGIGLLVASLIPASEREQELATSVKDSAAPAIDAVKGAAQDVAQNLKAPAQDAFDSVKQTAQSAASNVQGEAQSAASDVQQSAQESRENIQNS